MKSCTSCAAGNLESNFLSTQNTPYQIATHLIISGRAIILFKEELQLDFEAL